MLADREKESTAKVKSKIDVEKKKREVFCGIYVIQIVYFILGFPSNNKLIYSTFIEYEIFGEGSHISTNQRRESTVFSLLIG